MSSVMEELHRISADGGVVKIIVPYYNSEGANNDLTHRHFFTKHSLEPFYSENTRSNYFVNPKFELVSMTFMPTRLGRLFVFQKLQLIFSYVFGQVIHQIHFRLKAVKSGRSKPEMGAAE